MEAASAKRRQDRLAQRLRAERGEVRTRPPHRLDGGPHLSYMGQWFIFAGLGALFYGALLRRAARGRTSAAPVPVPVVDPVPASSSVHGDASARRVHNNRA